ncbi:MAG: hypothetical protein E6J50_02145 [Chloroflexi bacterium]|nr:MAG: hypothetical protein E6J50_02145 [Chloroflexota bacterium]
MIEGYSVDEAASVLGVPKGRVWELLARGILAGTPEDGGGMRVYLQGRPMEPIVGRPLPGRPEPDERPTGTNGNGGEHGQPGFEASPFRELLTEFRNLTERYGQALLALGEARGEVASLRTRVELLEARVDLRLPSPPLVQWSPPQPAPPVEESEPSPEAHDEAVSAAAPAVDEPEAPGVPIASTTAADGDEVPAALIEPPAVALEAAPTPARSAKRNKSRPRRRRQGARSATEGIAEALARAQDPTVTQLPGGDEAQAAFNELRERIRRETLAAEASEPATVNVPTEALAPEPDDAIGLAVMSAPAEAVELDSLLADEELGGAIQEQPTSVEEAPALEEAPAVAETAPVSPAQPVVPEERLAAAEAEATSPAYSHEWDEPDWIAEEDVDWGTNEARAPQEAFAMGESPEIGWAELPAAGIEQPAEQLEAPATELARDARDAGVEVEPLESFATDASTSQALEVEAPGPTSGQGGTGSEPRGAPAEEVRSQGPGQGPEQAAGSEEELMWLGDEFRAGPVAWSSPGRVSTLPRQTPAEATVSEAEDEALARLAVERGWDDAELDAIRSLLAQPGHVDLPGTELDATAATPDVGTPDAETRDEKASAEPREAEKEEKREEEAFDWERGPSAWNPPPLARESRDLPGAGELDEAMAAFEVSAWSKEAVSHVDDGPARSEAAAADVSGAPPQPTSTATHQDVPAPASTVTRPAPPSVITPDPERETDDIWLRGRRGPAASAYRRLRRLFP